MSNLTNSLQESFDLLQKLKLLNEEIFVEIDKEIENIPELKGVTRLSSSPNCAIISFSALSNRCWSPQYYMADCQKEAIRKGLAKCGKDLEKITKCIKKMLDDKFVKVNNDKTILNDNSLETLQKIYDGLSVVYKIEE